MFRAFVAFLRGSGRSFIYFFFLVAWRVAFMVHWGGIPVAFTAFVALMRRLGWFVSMGHLECLGLWGAGPCGVHIVCIV